MTTVALVVHEGRKEAVELAVQAAAWLSDRGHEVRVPPTDAAATCLLDHEVSGPALAEGCDVALSLGGDGTILRAVSLVARAGVPVLGVNLGTLGFLTAVEPGALLGALDRVVAGDYSVEERAMLAVATPFRRETSLEGPALALNEAVVEKSSPGRAVRLAVSVNGALLARYVADGLILATPTGSTAYAFSARGPILSPSLTAFQLTPVSPHMPFDRTLVLGPADVVSVEVVDRAGATVSLDGQPAGSLAPGETFTCSVSAVPARLATLGRRDFYGILRARFGLGDR